MDRSQDYPQGPVQGGAGGAPKERPQALRYWENRYQQGYNKKGWRTSAVEQFKVAVINRTLRSNNIHSLIDLGCGDGRLGAQLDVAYYRGLDVSPTAVELARMEQARADRRSSTVDVLDPIHTLPYVADATLSSEVIFHLLHERDYLAHLRELFACARVLAIVYSSNINYDPPGVMHVRHRRFLHDVPPNWKREVIVPPPRGLACTAYAPEKGKTFSKFHIFRRQK